MVKISASILALCPNKNTLLGNVKKLDKSSIDYIHLDIMDGNFVPDIPFSFEEMKKVSEISTKPLDVHLMVEDTKLYIETYKSLNPEYITIHYETDNVKKSIDLIKNYNIKAGISFNSETSVESIYKYLKDVDLVLIMSIIPGKSGQPFIENSLDKITQLKEYIVSNNLNVQIEIDGGITDKNVKECINRGIDIIVSASFITNCEDYELQIQKLRN